MSINKDRFKGLSEDIKAAKQLQRAPGFWGILGNT